MFFEKLIYMVGIAQLVRASGCGPEGHGFKSHYSPGYVFKGPHGVIG